MRNPSDSTKMNVVPDPIDWQQLALDLGTLRADGESGSAILARQALERIIGDGQWRAAVDHYVLNRPGFELARSVLSLVRPWAAMQRCHELFLHMDDQAARCSAIELLRVVADRRVLSRVPEYLSDANPGVQYWAAGIVDQLLWSDLVEPEECTALLEQMENHSHSGIQEKAAWIRSFLHRRQQHAESAGDTNSPDSG